MSPQIAVRLSAEEWAAVDALVAKGRCPSRAAVIREGLSLLVRAEREKEIGEAYRRGYELVPYDEGAESWIGETGRKSLADFYADRPEDADL